MALKRRERKGGERDIETETLRNGDVRETEGITCPGYRPPEKGSKYRASLQCLHFLRNLRTVTSENGKEKEIQSK